MKQHIALSVLVLAAALAPWSAFACDGDEVNAIGAQLTSQIVDGSSITSGAESDGDSEGSC